MDVALELIESVKADDRKKVKMILDSEPNLIDSFTKKGESLVLLASYHGSEEVLDVLLEKGKVHHLSVYEACALGNKDQVREKLYEKPSLINSFSGDGNTPLSLACFFGYLDIVKYLISKGAKVNLKTQNEEGQTALHAAILGRNLNIVKFLLETGAEVNANKKDGITPLHLAAESNQFHVMKILMIHKADLNARMEGDITPLTLAKINKANDAIEFLIRKGAIE